LEITRQGKFPQEQSRALQALGRVHSQMGQYVAAIAELREASDPTHAPNRLDRLAARNALGRVLAKASQPDAAILAFREVVTEARAVENLGEECTARAGLAQLQAASGDLRNARVEILKA